MDLDISALADEAIVSLTPKRSSKNEQAVAGEASGQWRPLPESAQLDPQLAAGASSWLDSYVEFSRRESPRAWEAFHEASGLWVLSTVAARRVVVQMGGDHYTNLYIALAARTGVHAKSTTARIAIEVLTAAGLDALLAPDECTPQAFLMALAGKEEVDWGKLTDPARERHVLRRAFAGQRGWFYDEFGQKIAGMMREGGFMADFRGLLRRFDDCPPQHDYRSVQHGALLVQRPYLALLASLTPADLRPYAKRGGPLWGDGFWARFAFVTPPLRAPLGTGRFCTGKRIIPSELVTQLRRWHERLGTPATDIRSSAERDEKKMDLSQVEVEDRPSQVCELGTGVYDAYYGYHDALSSMIVQGENEDLDGNYVRFAAKALRIAALLASLENHGVIELRHWARGQQIAEDWRRGLHDLYEQVNRANPTDEWVREEQVVALIREKGPLTAREVRQGVWKSSANEVNRWLDSLVRSGVLEEVQEGKTRRYHLAEDAPVSDGDDAAPEVNPEQ